MFSAPTLDVPSTTISQIIDNGQGLQNLLRASGTSQNPPPRCHPGTRRDYIETITKWGSNGDGRVGHILWVKGAVGIGKSALARSCAESLRDKLGAAIFFSRPNSRDDFSRFFLSISYQLALKLNSYADILDANIRRNPALLEKPPKQQFQDLVIDPLKILKDRGESLGELVIIVDGLQECADEKAQCDILDIVVESTRDPTASFLWIFFSRPEPHIITTFTSPKVSSLSLHIELPVTRDIDSEIAKYLSDELRKIRWTHNLPVSWPSQKDLGILVNLSDGLFIYATTVLRFINEGHSSDPEIQLSSILALATRRGLAIDGLNNHPLSSLDTLYTFFMERLPPETLIITRKILLAATFPSVGTGASVNANLLGLTEPQFRDACQGLHSVLKLDEWELSFHHASFLEFLQDSTRSGKLCIKADDCAATLRSELVEKLGRIHAESFFEENINIPITWSTPFTLEVDEYRGTVGAFFYLCQLIPLDPQTLAALSGLEYRKIPSLIEKPEFFIEELNPNALLQQIPKKLRNEIIRPFRYTDRFYPSRIPGSAPLYVLGHGYNKALCWERGNKVIVERYPRAYRPPLVYRIRRMIMG